MTKRKRQTLYNASNHKASLYSKLDEEVFGRVMQLFRDIAHPGNKEHASYDNDPRGRLGGTAQRTYLLPRHEQKDIFLEDGYIEDNKKDYGLVKKAVGNRNLPVYQTASDVIDRSKLIPIGNTYGYNSSGFINPKVDLVHAENHPSTIYLGIDGKFYQKAWDLNDYGGTDRGRSSEYSGIYKLGSNILDAIGSPTVVTTGYQMVTNPWGNKGTDYYPNGVTIQDLFDYSDDGYPYASTIGKMLDDFQAKRGLHRENINGKYIYALPEIVITGKRKRKTLSGKY